MDIKPDTQEVKTPSGAHTILARAYLTGEDRRANRRLFLKLADEGKAKTVDALEESENALIAQIILEIDGSKEDIVQRVLKMEVQDYDFLIGFVSDIANGIDKKKEVISDGNTKVSSEGEK